MPPALREELGYLVKDVSDKNQKELQPREIFGIFNDEFLNKNTPLELVDFHFTRPQNGDVFKAFVTIKVDGEEQDVAGTGNGRLAAVSDALS